VQVEAFAGLMITRRNIITEGCLINCMKKQRNINSLDYSFNSAPLTQ
jgi:hypothetical protein